MRFAYADPPYLGCCRLYRHEHGVDGLCWDDPGTHRKLIDRISGEFDGWALSLSVKSLATILPLCPDDVMVLAWFKPISPPLGDHRRYNWEPVLVRPVRRYGPGYVPIALIASPPMFTFRDTPNGHVIGEKPEAFAHWVFASAGLTREDTFTDVFTGSGALDRAWATYEPGPTVRDGYAEAKVVDYGRCGTCGGSGSEVIRGQVPDYDRCSSCHGTGFIFPAELVERVAQAISGVEKSGRFITKQAVAALAVAADQVGEPG